MSHTTNQLADKYSIRVKKEAPDFKFIILRSENNRIPVGSIRYFPSVKKSSSVGYVHTAIGLNKLMSDVFNIICPLKSDTESIKLDAEIYQPSGVYFSPDFPEFLIPQEDPGYNAPPQVIKNAITWGVVRQEPGTVGGEPFRGTQELTPRFREKIVILSDEHSQWVVGDDSTGRVNSGGIYKSFRIKGQVYDNLLQYNIWSKSNQEVEELTEWFIGDFMPNYKGLFREMGINEILFNRRVRDDTLVQMKNGYHVRSVLYYVRTERLFIDTIEPINRINLDVQVNDREQLAKAFTNDLELDKTLQQKIIEKWVDLNILGG